jgi:hypothetical protein
MSQKKNNFTVFPRIVSFSISISRQASDRAILNRKAERAFKGRRISPPSIGHATRSEGYRTASSSEAPRRILRHPSVTRTRQIQGQCEKGIASIVNHE